MRYEIIEAAQNSPWLRFDNSAIELLAGKLLHRRYGGAYLLTAWAARLCQEPSLGVLADIDPFSIDELGEAIRRNADGGVGRAACSHDLAKAFQLDIEEHRQRSGKAEGRDGSYRVAGDF